MSPQIRVFIALAIVLTAALAPAWAGSGEGTSSVAAQIASIPVFSDTQSLLVLGSALLAGAGLLRWKYSASRK